MKVLIRKTHFEKDLEVLEKSESCRLAYVFFKNNDYLGSYEGIPIGKINFAGITREFRTTFLRCITGVHFCSEKTCKKFHRIKTGVCPFCKNSSRDLTHYTLHCPHFNNIRRIFLKKIESLNPLVHSYRNQKNVFLETMLSTDSSIVLKTFSEFLHTIKVAFEM